MKSKIPSNNGVSRLKLKWTKRALEQLKTAHDYIAEENPVVAQAVAQRIWDATELLLTQPEIGRQGRITGTREWVIKKTPYLLAYVVEDDSVQILRVIHSKQRWPDILH